MTNPNPTRNADTANINRAPRGGAVSLVNGLFYLGGQFMPMAVEPVRLMPAPLAGSVRQVAWANRLRREALASLDDEINARLIGLGDRKETRAYRPAVRRLLIARHALWTERSASAVIDRRAELV
jgi:hypothetical protein